MKTLIVTAANESYAPFLRDLIESLDPHRAGLNSELAIVDLGLSPESRNEFARRAEHLIAPEWPFKPHPVFSHDRVHLSRAARPFLPDLVPGFDVYVWLDADVWVQDPLGLRWLIEAAAISDIAAVPTLHRAYRLKQQDVAWIEARYRMAFDAEAVGELMSRPYINAGVFAAKPSSNLWRHYAARFQTALDRWQGSFLSDQAVVNATIVFDGIHAQLIPARANWICHLARPFWDARAKRFVEPAMPYDPILLMHNTLTEKLSDVPISATNGQVQKMKLTYTAFKALL